MAHVDKILKASADELEKMTDADLELHFSSQLHITRPTLNKQRTSTILTRADASPRLIKPVSSDVAAKRERARLIAEKFGVNINDLM